MRVALYAGAFKENQDGATRSLYQLVRSLQADPLGRVCMQLPQGKKDPAVLNHVQGGGNVP